MVGILSSSPRVVPSPSHSRGSLPAEADDASKATERMVVIALIVEKSRLWTHTKAKVVVGSTDVESIGRFALSRRGCRAAARRAVIFYQGLPRVIFVSGPAGFGRDARTHEGTTREPNDEEDIAEIR